MIVSGDLTAVLGDLDMAIAYGVKHEKVYSLRGMIRTQTGDFRGAIADYQNALGLEARFRSSVRGTRDGLYQKRRLRKGYPGFGGLYIADRKFRQKAQRP